MSHKKQFLFGLTFIIPCFLFAQDSVMVWFRYQPQQEVVRVFLPGTFNNWGPNSNGVIQSDAASRMMFVDSLSAFFKPLTLISGTRYQYKIHEHLDASNLNDNHWVTDPLNPLFNAADNNNSIIDVENVFIFQIDPKPGSVITKARPFLEAGLCISLSDSILVNESHVILDDSVLSLQDYFLSDFSLLRVPLDGLTNGLHQAVIEIMTVQGRTVRDSTDFTLQGGELYFFTPSQDSVWADMKTIRWRVNLSSTPISRLFLKPIGKGPIAFTPMTDTNFTYQVALEYGINRFVLEAGDGSGNTYISDTLALNYPRPRHPTVELLMSLESGRIRLYAKAEDPQNGPLQFVWSEQPLNPFPLPQLASATDSVIHLPIPAQGHYAVRVSVTDEEGFSNQSVQFIEVLHDGSVILPALETAPSWIPEARLYQIFIYSLTEAGSLESAVSKLDYIRDMGFSVIWVLPVMDVEGSLDRWYNIGYNITDFYHIDPAYGCSEDFRTFVDAAHERGLRIILDVTCNHSSRSHPFALDAREKKLNSRYYDFYQHETIPHDTYGLGQTVSEDSIVYYTGFSDALLNWNWSESEARKYMLEVYQYYLKQYDIDGFRLDAYWAPNRKYGRGNFDIPLREALRQTKSDILILGETSGTGSGTELQYADQSGALDMANDWILKDAVWRYPSADELHNKLMNAQYRPGSNATFLRFMENHDEDRVIYRYNSIEKTMPVSAAIFLAPGVPAIFQGQETGQGYQVPGAKELRIRSNVDWNNPIALSLTPHYQRLAQIRAQFPAFARQFEDINRDGSINGADASVFIRLASSESAIYAFGRPWPDQNGLAVINFSEGPKSVSLDLHLADWAEFEFPFSLSEVYYLNNLTAMDSSPRTGAELENLSVTLSAYGYVIYTISTLPDTVELPRLAVSVDESAVLPFNNSRLIACSPNPFNPITEIRYRLSAFSQIRLEVYDIRGRLVRVLMDQEQGAGVYSARFDGSGLASGVYICRLQTESPMGRVVRNQKMMLLK